MSKLSLQVEFSKYEGAGNDFVIVDDRQKIFPIAEVARVCHRRFGIGADGVILLQEGRGADFTMRIFNSDGGEAESCGNGLRCFLHFAVELGFPKKRSSIAIGERIVWGEWKGDEVSIDMGKPKDLHLHIETELGRVHFVDTGVPHVVLFVPNVEKADLKTAGPLLRHHGRFQPRGANVNAVEISDPIRVRTYERGVEGETLACGTGAVAVAVTVKEIHGSRECYRIAFPGGELSIREEGGHFWMSGPARCVYRGIVPFG